MDSVQCVNNIREEMFSYTRLVISDSTHPDRDTTVVFASLS